MAVITGAAVLKISPFLLLVFRRAAVLARGVGAQAAAGVLFAGMLIGAGGDTLAHFAARALPAVGRGSVAIAGSRPSGLGRSF